LAAAELLANLQTLASPRARNRYESHGHGHGHPPKRPRTPGGSAFCPDDRTFPHQSRARHNGPFSALKGKCDWHSAVVVQRGATRHSSTDSDDVSLGRTLLSGARGPARPDFSKCFFAGWLRQRKIAVGYRGFAVRSYISRANPPAQGAGGVFPCSPVTTSPAPACSGYFPRFQ